MNKDLSTDEYAALFEILKSPIIGRPSACVARNAKRLAGLKFIAYEKSGKLALTEKGRQTLFVKQCVDGLRAIATDPKTPLDTGVLTFLEKKGHLVRNVITGVLELTPRGRETLADIDGGTA